MNMHKCDFMDYAFHGHARYYIDPLISGLSFEIDKNTNINIVLLLILE